MNKCTIIGKTNVGKTVFFINFAEYLGVKNLDIQFVNHNGVKRQKKLSPKTAMLKLVDNKLHKTLCIQSIDICLPMGKGKKKIQLIDSTGLIDDIHSDLSVRKAIAQTLNVIRESDIILHIIDASAASCADLPNAMGEVDYQIAQFARLKRGYVILANKMDLPNAQAGLQKIQEELQGNFIIPISAINKTGFDEVKTFVSHNI